MATPGTEVKVSRIPNCDICRSEPAAYDGRMKAGRPWAYMCEGCWQKARHRRAWRRIWTEVDSR